MGKKLILQIIIIALIVASCSNQLQTDNSNQKMQSETMVKYVNIETGKGTIKAELFTAQAPITTKNFIQLAESGFYNGLTFHRVESGFVVQGGDPRGDGTGGSPNKIPLEINPALKHVKGAMAMARTQDPNSATSQFYITLNETPFLDGNYAVFGKVTSGMDVVEQIKVGDKMNKVYITDK